MQQMIEEQIKAKNEDFKLLIKNGIIDEDILKIIDALKDDEELLEEINNIINEQDFEDEDEDFIINFKEILIGDKINLKIFKLYLDKFEDALKTAGVYNEDLYKMISDYWVEVDSDPMDNMLELWENKLMED